jgi:N-acetylglucosaminyldiphosphoundecaprenol N-acetyl-beta-D-mannosaminyltransferase
MGFREDRMERCEPAKIKILSVPFSCCGFDEIMVEMADAIKRRDVGHIISITNTESAYHALRIADHLKYIGEASFSCCDGVGVVLAGMLLGEKVPRLHGPDLMWKCCEYGIAKGWRHFFYGGKKGVADLLNKKLTVRFPGLICAGLYAPPFRRLTSEEDHEVIGMINDAKPDILWVGLGLLKQEKWIADHMDKIEVPWMIGVGAAFDFHAGTVRRAPKLFRTVGLEWLYRTAFEPRMFRRAILSLFFLGEVAKHLLRGSIREKT